MSWLLTLLKRLLPAGRILKVWGAKNITLLDEGPSLFQGPMAYETIDDCKKGWMMKYDEIPEVKRAHEATREA